MYRLYGMEIGWIWILTLLSRKGDGMEKVKEELKKRPLCLAFLINAIFLLAVIFFGDMKYEVSDDFVMDTILSGAYGTQYDAHLLFSNMILGYGLKLLYMLIPKVSWYFIMHITLCFLALTCISFIILSERTDVVGVALTILFVSFFSDDLYLLVQFTKTAAVSLMAGGCLFLYAFWKFTGKRRIFYGIFGAVMCCMGGMVRRACVNMVLPFLFLIFVWILLGEISRYLKSGDKDAKSASIRKILRKAGVGILLCGGLLICVDMLWKADSYLWNRYPEYQQYRVQNATRASITDIGGYDRDQVIAQMEQLEGTTIEDYYTLQSWNFVDQGIYTPERLEQLASVIRGNAIAANHSVKAVLRTLWERHYERYTVVWCLVLLFLLNLVLCKKKAWKAVIDGMVAGGLLAYLAYSGRILYRVEYGIFFCLAVVWIWHLLSEDGLGRMGLQRSVKSERVWLLGIVFLLVAKIPLYVPDTSYKTMTDEEYNQYINDIFYESWNFNLRKYRACVNKRPVYDELITAMEQDIEHYYLCDFSSTIQLLYYHYKPWIRLPIGYYKDTYSYLGGVTSYYPGCYYVWAENGLDPYNPYRTIANENILVVDNQFQLTKINYYKQYYNSDAIETQVDEKSGFIIWKIGNRVETP